MRTEWKEIELLLHEDKPLRLSGNPGMEILCLSGVAWVTVAGDGDDHFVTAGQTFRIASDGLVLADAIGGRAHIRLSMKKAPRGAFRIATATGEFQEAAIRL